MRKSELAKHIPKTYRKDPVSELFKADGENVYMLAGIEAYDTEHGRKIAHFTWGKDYITADIRPEGVIWSHTLAGTCGLHFRAKEKDPALAEFLRREKSDKWTLSCFEDTLNWRRRRSADDRKQKRIDAYMKEAVPPLPKGFAQKIRKMGKDLKPGKYMDVKMFQKTESGAVLERMFWIYRPEGEDQKIKACEFCRAFTTDYGGSWEAWYYGQYSGKVGEKQKFWPKKQGIGTIPKRYFVYDNFDEEDMTRQQESCLRIMSGKVDPSYVLSILKRHPELEPVIKSGWTHIVADLCDRDYQGIQDDAVESISRIPKTMLDRLRRVNAGWQALQVLVENPKLSDHWLQEISRWKLESKIYLAVRIGRLVNLNHALTLISKGGNLTQERMSKYIDYLRMAENSGRNICDELIYRDKRWEERHDAYLEEINAKKDREREEERKRQFRGIERDYERNRRIFEWQQDGVCMVIPKSFQDIVTEGRLQHHCVGASDRYMGSMARRETWIIFLRHTDDPETPWYTIETDGGAVLQFYAAYDRQPEREKVFAILTEWMKSVRKNLEKVLEEEAEAKREEEVLQAAG